MKKFLPILKNTQLFSGMGDDELLCMLTCLDAKTATYRKGEYLVRQGEYLDNITVLLNGSCHLQRDDYWGNRSIVSVIGVGDMFGEAYAARGSCAALNDVVAAEDSTVIHLSIKKMLNSCSNTCKHHALVIQNLFFAISDKNRQLVQKLGHISRRTTREKLLSYLSDEAKRQKSGTFTIPFNRQQLADFLSVDRSAMSNELCKMRDEGLLSFDKNNFTLNTNK